MKSGPNESSVNTTANMVAAGALVLEGANLESTLETMKKIAGATYDLRSDSIELGTHLKATPLQFSKKDSVAKIFEELGISPRQEVQVFCADLKTVFEMTAPKFEQLYNEHLRRRLYDYMIKDSTNSWCVVINHSGGVMYSKESGF